MESIFFVEATIPKGICYDIAPTSGSSVGYHEKQYLVRLTDGLETYFLTYI